MTKKNTKNTVFYLQTNSMKYFLSFSMPFLTILVFKIYILKRIIRNIVYHYSAIDKTSLML